jgi:hypothetical protein
VVVLLFLFFVIIIILKKKETEFLLAAVLFTYGSGTVQNRFFGGIRYRPFVSRKGTTF